MALPPSTTFRTAIDLKEAVDEASTYLTPIGFCPSALDGYEDAFDIDHAQYSKEDMKWRYEAEDYKGLMERLRKIQVAHYLTYAKGSLEAPFTLTVTREGCNFSGKIFPKYHESREKAAERLRDMENLLKRWFESGAISGYGDVRTQETKIDTSVRNGREIPATEFSVEPELLETVKEHWAAHFYPSKVRVEPYKIHLYGPGGKFAEHRDTPETDLVGTFLVGLGHFGEGGGLRVEGMKDWQSYASHSGTWIAFHPDIPHEVKEIKEGYRAVIAFKIFRLSGVQEDPADSVQSNIKDILEKMPRKFGMFLEHSYCKGTTQFNSWDAQLYAAAKSMSDVDIFVLPVLTRLGLQHHAPTDYGTKHKGDYMFASVYPLMEPHFNALIKILASERTVDKVPFSSHEDVLKESREFVDNCLKDTEAAWIMERNVHNVPFFTQDMNRSVLEWRHDQEDASEYVGNESRPETDDSIYLSYGMVVLPKRGIKRKLGSSEESSSD